MENFLQKGSLGAMAFGQVIPAALLSGLRILLIEGLADNNSARSQAINTLKKLNQIRTSLYRTLELTLELIENWIENNPQEINKDKQSTEGRNLMLRGQTLEDQLTALEDLENRIYALLEASNH